jgi:CheY-like chemotaxis protein
VTCDSGPVQSGYSDNAIADRVSSGPVSISPKAVESGDLVRKMKTVIGMRRRAQRILVADDDNLVRRLFYDVLRRAEYEVRVAENGQEAIRMMRREPCDLLITDLVMPEGEGLETIQAIRKEWPGLKVLAISAAFEGQFLQAAKLLGADKALMKPISPEALRDVVCELLEEPARGSETGL